MFEIRVLGTIFGTNRDEVTREWRRQHKEGLYDLYSSPNVRVINSGRMSLAGHVALRGTGELHTGLWWEDLMGRDPLGRPRHRWEDNIKVYH